MVDRPPLGVEVHLSDRQAVETCRVIARMDATEPAAVALLARSADVTLVDSRVFGSCDADIDARLLEELATGSRVVLIASLGCEHLVGHSSPRILPPPAAPHQVLSSVLMAWRGPDPARPPEGYWEALGTEQMLLDSVHEELAAVGRLTGFVKKPTTSRRSTLARTIAGTLSARERQVAALLADNWRVGQIAQALFISEVTVRSHLKGIFRKCAVRSQADLIARIREEGY